MLKDKYKEKVILREPDWPNILYFDPINIRIHWKSRHIGIYLDEPKEGSGIHQNENLTYASHMSLNIGRSQHSQIKFRRRIGEDELQLSETRKEIDMVEMIDPRFITADMRRQMNSQYWCVVSIFQLEVEERRKQHLTSNLITHYCRFTTTGKRLSQKKKKKIYATTIKQPTNNYIHIPSTIEIKRWDNGQK